MLRSTRAALALGLGCMGVAGMVGQSVAQQQQGDNKVRQTAAANPASTPAVPMGMPPVSIGTVDVEGVFREYYKVAVAGETLESEVKLRYAELTKLANEGKMEQEKLGNMKPGTADAKRCEDRMVQIKAQIEAGRENAQREFTQKETETMAGIYNEVAAMVQAIAKERQMTFVVKYNDGKVQATEPNSAMSAMSKTFIYSDPRVDITKDTIKYLNYRYTNSGGKMPRAAAANNAANPAPVAAPTARTAAPGTR